MQHNVIVLYSCKIQVLVYLLVHLYMLPGRGWNLRLCFSINCFIFPLIVSFSKEQKFISKTYYCSVETLLRFSLAKLYLLPKHNISDDRLTSERANCEEYQSVRSLKIFMFYLYIVYILQIRRVITPCIYRNKRPSRSETHRALLRMLRLNCDYCPRLSLPAAR